MTGRSSKPPLPIAVLISGGGTTLRNLIVQQQAGQLPVEFKCVISSNPRAGGLQFATGSPVSIPAHTIQREDFDSTEAYSDAIFERCRREASELVVMGGFLKLVRIPSDFTHRVINIHPALIPSFCGKGFYGLRVHRAALQEGATETGCTVHFVDDQYDHGPIILQRKVPVLDGDTPELLAARVFDEECRAYPEAIRLFAEGRLHVDGNRVIVS